MFEKIKNFFFITIFIVFVFLISKYYFSEKNYLFTNKSRTSYTVNLNDKNSDLPILKSDTNNIITFKNDLEKFKKKKKKKILGKINIK